MKRAKKKKSSPPLVDKRMPLNRMWGLCQSCIIRSKEKPKELEPAHLYRITMRWFDETLPITEPLCADCWRLLYELRSSPIALAVLERIEAVGEPA